MVPRPVPATWTVHWTTLPAHSTSAPCCTKTPGFVKIGCTAGVDWKICNRLSLKTGTRCYAKVLLKPRRKWKKLSPSSLCWYNLVDVGAHRLAWWCSRPVLQSVVSVSRLNSVHLGPLSASGRSLSRHWENTQNLETTVWCYLITAPASYQTWTISWR